MRRLALVLMTIVFCLSGLRVVVDGQTTECPKITVAGPSGITIPGDTMLFTANVNGGGNYTYDWTVSAGMIESGQGTQSIAVRTTKEISGFNVTASVKILGLPSQCENTASETGGVTPQVIGDPVDDYGVIQWNHERARLDNLWIQLQHNPKSRAFLHIYLSKGQTIEQVKSHLIYIRKHFRFRDKDFDLSRLIFGLEKSRESRTVVWLMPENGDLPECKDCKIIYAKDLKLL